MELIVREKFDSYPQHIKPLMLELRTLILNLAKQQSLGLVEESLKWGEPSYLVKNGTSIRIDWKAKTPEYYYIFFNCKTKLIDTCRELYSDILTLEGNRAIVLNVDKPLPLKTIQHCIELALNYKKLKHLLLLGV